MGYRTREARAVPSLVREHASQCRSRDRERWESERRQFGLIVAGALNVGTANGCTRAFISAARMHPSAGFPAAPPVTLTLCTVPSD